MLVAHHDPLEVDALVVGEHLVGKRRHVDSRVALPRDVEVVRLELRKGLEEVLGGGGK